MKTSLSGFDNRTSSTPHPLPPKKKRTNERSWKEKRVSSS
jgi:hypothetical protein